MSNKDKGLKAAISIAFPKGALAYCCQHIANNVQQRYSVKCKLLFWQCA